MWSWYKIRFLGVVSGHALSLLPEHVRNCPHEL